MPGTRLLVLCQKWVCIAWRRLACQGSWLHHIDGVNRCDMVGREAEIGRSFGEIDGDSLDLPGSDARPQVDCDGCCDLMLVWTFGPPVSRQPHVKPDIGRGLRA